MRRVEDGKIAGKDLTEAKTYQTLCQMAPKLDLWKLLKSWQIVILASHTILAPTRQRSGVRYIRMP